MKRGVTLLELLVAISLFGMVSLGLLFSLRIAVSAWQKSNARLAADRRVLAAGDLFAEQVANARPRIVAWGPQDHQVKIFYFQGLHDRLRFLTATSLSGRSRSGLWLVEYSFRQDDGGRCRLAYNEWPFSYDSDAAQTIQDVALDQATSRMVIRFITPQTTPQTRDLYSDLESCGFEYLTERPGEESRWETEWISLRPSLPPAVAVRFRGREGRGISPVAMVAKFNVREVKP
jgi:prepilin-type N-terminal cleavage/methylation domain-containing protein